MENYEELLNLAYKEINPVSTSNLKRFEVPKIDVQIIGNKTYINNFQQICSYVRRDQGHLSKFLSNELNGLMFMHCLACGAKHSLGKA